MLKWNSTSWNKAIKNLNTRPSLIKILSWIFHLVSDQSTKKTFLKIKFLLTLHVNKDNFSSNEFTSLPTNIQILFTFQHSSTFNWGCSNVKFQKKMLKIFLFYFFLDQKNSQSTQFNDLFPPFFLEKPFIWQSKAWFM